MMRSTSLFLLFAGITAFTPAVAAADERADPSIAAQMSLSDAKHLLQKWRMYYGSVISPDMLLDVLVFTPTEVRVVQYSVPPGKYIGCPYETFDPYIESKTDVVSAGTHKGEGFFTISTQHQRRGCLFYSAAAPDHATAVVLAAAMLRWKNSTLAERQALPARDAQAFAAVVAAYQTSNPRPQISEDVRRFNVMAESAIRDKRLSDAVEAYNEGLKLAPWWPEGHFNEALILGELHYYDEAIDHMHKYILLAPNAPDARKAQDQIYAWQGEVQALWPNR